MHNSIHDNLCIFNPTRIYCMTLMQDWTSLWRNLHRILVLVHKLLTELLDHNLGRFSLIAPNITGRQICSVCLPIFYIFPSFSTRIVLNTK